MAHIFYDYIFAAAILQKSINVFYIKMKYFYIILFFMLK